MRKVLLTVMMVSSLLAFNACKKDGAVGPAGPKGDTGATGAAGAAGAVGAAGAKGADGTKILSGTVDPTTEGAVGDFYFNKTTKTLWGPKAAAGWAGTGTSLTGTTGSVMLAGTGVPSATAPTNAKEGDYYFDATTSIVWGPKMADGTWGGQIPLASGAGARNYVFAKGFDQASIVETVGARVVGQSVTASYSDYSLFTTFKILPQDIIRITNYSGWATNREMVFETAPGSGIFTAALTNFGQIGTAPYTLNAQFKYVKNGVDATFNFTQEDIDRLTSNGGTGFPYFTYAAVLNTALGSDMTFAKKKNFKVANDPTRFATTYTATTALNINTLPGGGVIEDVKRDGKLFVKYKYFNAKTATGGNTLVTVVNNQAGWNDLTPWANSYVGATATSGYDNGTTGANPFNGNVAFGTASQLFMGSGTYFGNGGTSTFANGGNTAVGNMDLTATVTFKGRFLVNWAITSGVPNAAAPHAVGDGYYNSAAGNLTWTNTAGTTAAVVADNINYNDTNGGLEPAALAAIKLVQVQVLAVPAANVTAAKAKGVDINNANALADFIKL